MAATCYIKKRILKTRNTSSVQIVISTILFICFGSCKEGSKLDYAIPNSEVVPPVTIIADSVIVEGDLGAFKISKSISEEIEGIQNITFTFRSETPAELKPAAIKFNFPSVDINGFWNPNISMDKVNYYYSGITAKASRYAPVLAFHNNKLENRITIALSDALNQSQFSSYLKEEDVHFYPEIRLFEEKMPKML